MIGPRKLPKSPNDKNTYRQKENDDGGRLSAWRKN